MHDQEFRSGQWDHPSNNDHQPWQEFIIGTCRGQWRSTTGSFEILSVINDNPGNGHFEDVLDWFFVSCVRARYRLKIFLVHNEKFRRHLMQKRGFSSDGVNVYITFEEIFEIVEKKMKVNYFQKGINF